MTPTLIVLGFLVGGVAIIVFATRRRGPGAAQPRVDPETGWEAPFTPANASVAEAAATPAASDIAGAAPAQTEEARS